MSLKNKSNFERGLQLADFLKTNKPKVELKHHGFLIGDYDRFVKSHATILENKRIFEKSYEIYKTWYMRAYDIKKQIEKQNE